MNRIARFLLAGPLPCQSFTAGPATQPAKKIWHDGFEATRFEVDAPVFGFKSWPGGKGKRAPSGGKQVLDVHCLTEEAAPAHDKNPASITTRTASKIPRRSWTSS